MSGRPGVAPEAPRCHAPLLRLACPACAAGLVASRDGLACPGCGADYPERDGLLALVSRAASSGAPGFDPHFFPGLEQIEERHFWFLVRRRLIRQRLLRHVPDLAGRALFDIGCGTGSLLAYLERGGVPLAGACDAYPQALACARRRVRAPLVLIAEGQPPPLAAGQTLISMFDVLEHLDDDAGTLRWLASVLAPGGVLVLTVPAHPFLYDEKDRLSQHRRRYTRAGLRALLAAAGFEVRALEHFMAALLIPRLVGRLLPIGTQSNPDGPDTLKVVPGLNGLMLALLETERRLTSWGGPPFGTSLLAIARRA